MREQFHFFKIALFDRSIGALARSSKYVVRRVTEVLDDRHFRRVVEYGPGDGVMTRELLRHLPPDGELIAVEANPKFVKMLKKIRDPRLRVIEGTIQEVAPRLLRYGFGHVDLAVSSIPFSSLSEHDREAVVRHTFDALADGGDFIVFHQYSRLMLNPLKKFFPDVHTSFEPRNVLPCFIIFAQK